MKLSLKSAGVAALALAVAVSSGCQSSKTGQPSQPSQPSQATAAQKAAHQKQLFQEADSNSDGRIHADEFTNYFYVVSFTIHDVDSDERLTVIELYGPDHSSPERTLFAEMDADGTSWLVLEEYSSHPLRTVTVTNAFRTIDRNGDMYLELDELTN